MSWDCGLRYVFSVPPALQPGSKCILHDKEDLSRLEMVQRLAKDGCRFLQNHSKGSERTSGPQSDEAVRWCLRESGHDVLVLQRVSSQQPALAASARGGGREEARNGRYVVVSGTPEKILEHLLNDLTLDEDQGNDSDTLLDDFLLTYPVFMSTSDLCQALLGHYCTKRQRGKEEPKENLERKQKLLHLVSEWMCLCRDFLRDDEHVKVFLKTLYRYVSDDVYEHPALEKDVVELQRVYQLHRRQANSPERADNTLPHPASPLPGLRSDLSPEDASTSRPHRK